MTSNSYRRSMGRLDSFETANAAFDVLTGTLKQATLFSYVGYDSPTAPTAYRLKSSLHFITGRQDALNLDQTVENQSHAVFFQAPLGISGSADLRSANLLLSATGFFIAYGADPIFPDILDGKVERRWRYRLFQWIEPREQMTTYSRTVTAGAIPVANESYHGTDWFSDPVNAKRGLHSLAENVITLVILPVYEGDRWRSYYWNSRDGEVSETHHRLPQSVHVLLAVIDEGSAIRLGGAATPPSLLPEGLFEDPAKFDEDVVKMEAALTDHTAALNFRVFRAVISLGVANTGL